jgi:hypothetical protein
MELAVGTFAITTYAENTFVKQTLGWKIIANSPNALVLKEGYQCP